MTQHTALHTLVIGTNAESISRLTRVIESLFPNSRFVSCTKVEEAIEALNESSFDLRVVVLDRIVARHAQLFDRLREEENAAPVAILVSPASQDKLYELVPDLDADWAVILHDQISDRGLGNSIRAAIGRSELRWERNHLQRAFRSSLLQYRSLFDEVPDIIFLCDRTGCLLDVNAKASRVFGEPKDKLLLRPIFDVFGIAPEVFHRLVDAATRMSGPIEDVEVEYHPPKGQSIHGLTHMITAQQAPGRPVVFQGVIKDITQHKLLERQLRHSEVNYRTLYELARISSSSLQLEETARRSLGLITSSCHALGGLLLMNSRFDELNVLVSENLAPDLEASYLKARPIQIGRGIVGRWAIGGKIQSLGKDQFDRLHSGLHDWLREIGADRVVGCPLGPSNLNVPTSILLLALAGAGDDPDEELLQGMAKTLEMGINNCHHYANSREAENKYRELWEHAPAFFLSILKGGVLFEVNLTAARALGYRLQDMIGRRFTEFLDPRDREGFLARHTRIVEEGIEQTCEVRLQKKDGEILIASMTSEPLTNKEGVRIGEKTVLYDITRDKMLEASLREHSETLELKVEERTAELTRAMDFLNGILDGSTECAIFGLDARGGFVHFNRGAQFMLHYNPEEMVRLRALDSVIDFDASGGGSLAEILGGADEKDVLVREVRMRTSQGRELIAQLSVNRLHAPGDNDLVYVAIANDITERKKLEELLKDYNEKLEQEIARKMKELDQKHIELIQSSKLATLGEMATGIAHELNQPLSGIRTRAQLLTKMIQKGRADETKILTTQRDIMDLVDRISRIIHHMRVFARQDEQPFAPFEVTQSIDGCLSLLGEQLRLHAVQLDLEIPPNSPRIRGEPMQIEQVLLNLVSNARYAMDLKEQQFKKAGRGGDYQKRLIIRLSQPVPGEICLSVSDNGVGMAPASYQRIFQPFYTTKPVGEGTGLGLSISYGIIVKHHGRIEVESTEGEGTNFHLYLPVWNGADTAISGDSSAPQAPPAAPARIASGM